MLRFVFIASLALVPASSLAGIPDFKTAVEQARFGDLTTVCKWFCDDDDDDYYDYFLRSLGKDVIHPRIFCELCKKKTTSTSPTTPSTTSSDIPTTTISTTSSTMSSETPSTITSTTPSTTSSETTSSTSSTTPSTTSTESTTSTTTTTEGVQRLVHQVTKTQHLAKEYDDGKFKKNGIYCD